MKVSKLLARRLLRELTIAISLNEMHPEITDCLKAAKVLRNLAKLIEDQTVKTVEGDD